MHMARVKTKMVIPAQAGTHNASIAMARDMGPRLRWNAELGACRTLKVERPPFL